MRLADLKLWEARRLPWDGYRVRYERLQEWPGRDAWCDYLPALDEQPFGSEGEARDYARRLDLVAPPEVRNISVVRGVRSDGTCQKVGTYWFGAEFRPMLHSRRCPWVGAETAERLALEGGQP